MSNRNNNMKYNDCFISTTKKVRDSDFKILNVCLLTIFSKKIKTIVTIYTIVGFIMLIYC